jgi:hypothetical protein
MSKFNIPRLIHEAMLAVASKDNPITVWPKVGPSGRLMWIVKDSIRTVVIDTETGMIHGNANTIENSEAFDAIVGALREWYVMDRESYGGENIIKIKDEVDNYLP